MTDSAEELAWIEDLAPQIDIQAGSTVSKTVLKAEGLRIVLFAFDAGEVLSEHTAAMPVVLQVIEGRLSVTAAGRTVELVPGGVVHLATREPHSVEALEPTKMALLMLA